MIIWAVIFHGDGFENIMLAVNVYAEYRNGCAVLSRARLQHRAIDHEIERLEV